MAFLGKIGLGLGAVVCLAGCSAARVPSAGSATGAGWHELHGGEIRRTVIASQPATGLPGWETRLYLIEYGPGAQAPLHVHPVVGVGQVLVGSFESAFGDEPVVRVDAGQGFTDPPAVAHRVFRNPSQDQPLRFMIAYTIRKDEPNFYPGPALPASP